MNTVTKRKALGRGLSSLIPTRSAEAGDGKDGGEIHDVDIGAIDPNPYQPRVDFDDAEIVGLAESIKNQGLLQPVVLRQAGGRYEIISGERRFRAFKYLQRETVPCYVRGQVSDSEMLELALVENIQREELNEIETSIAYKKLLEQCGYTHDALAQKVGKSRAAVSNSLRLLNLPGEVQEMVRRGEISVGHARAVLSIEGAQRQVEAARRVVLESLTVRDVESFAKGGKSGEPGGGGGGKAKPAGPKGKDPEDPDIAHQLERLRYKYGTPVRLKVLGDGKGRVEIEYFSQSDMVRLFDLLLDDTVLDDVSAG
ncbi:MAG: ParB/RepB/Spo0J family partition protein [Chitinispirillales bacterium]|nr:ParB/RepB/Spo0J family partition protein [Chitinispirillales bacterium]